MKPDEETGGVFPAMEPGEANHRAWTLLEEPCRLLGLTAREISDPSATDAAYLSTFGVPTVDALSALAEDIHTTRERVSIPSIRQRTALCALTLGLLPRQKGALRNPCA